MKTICITFTPVNVRLPSPQAGDLFREGRWALLRRGLKCEPAQSATGVLKAFFHSNDWTKNFLLAVIKSYPENTHWDNPPDGFVFTNMTVIYDNAFLPFFVIKSDKKRSYDWRDGNFQIGESGRPIMLTCASAAKTVSLSMEICANCDTNVARQEFVSSLHRLEIMILQTRMTRRLIAAFREKESNCGRIDRCITDLLGWIGTF